MTGADRRRLATVSGASLPAFAAAGTAVSASGPPFGARIRTVPAPGAALVSVRRASYDRAMTEAIAFDTHRFVKRLTESGFTERQAETLAEEHVALLNANLATKADIAGIGARVEALRQETRADIARVEAGVETLRQETKADIARVEAGVETLRQETKADIETLRQETKADIARVGARIETAKADLLKWLFGALIAQGGLIVALVKLL